MTVTWKIAERPRYNSLDTTVYRSSDGVWILCKEYFAAGPSMFSWMLYRDDYRFEKEFRTKKAATKYVNGQ